jgi:hypothetical protein
MSLGPHAGLWKPDGNLCSEGWCQPVNLPHGRPRHDKTPTWRTPSFSMALKTVLSVNQHWKATINTFSICTAS